ncbi:MAG TPA: hypothetical protein VF519_09820 [Mycobacteriales bacterium]|jgi:hypothetical protein
MTTRLLAAALAALACVAAPAAAELCAGTTQTYVVCAHPENLSVDPDGGPPAGDCVYVNADACTPVFVPTPSAGATGPLVSTRCGTLTC